MRYQLDFKNAKEIHEYKAKVPKGWSLAKLIKHLRKRFFKSQGEGK